jgi:hypothetical protein
MVFCIESTERDDDHMPPNWPTRASSRTLVQLANLACCPSIQLLALRWSLLALPQT